MNRGEGVCRNSIDIALTIDGDTASAIISEADHSVDKTLVVAADGAILIAIRPTKRGVTAWPSGRMVSHRSRSYLQHYATPTVGSLMISIVASR